MAKPKESDQQLWDRLRSGDDDAYSLIYNRYTPVMFSYGMQFSSDRELIKDCIQDVFVKLYTNRKKINTTTNIKFFLFVILKNHLYNYFKKELSFTPFIKDIDIPKIDLSPETQLMIKEEAFLQQEKLNHLLKILSPRQQEVLYYRYIEELNFEEIEQLMHINYQSIQNLIQRSLKKIRENNLLLFFFQVISV
ncbi:MAG: sigma-70 family RNA polymerase sigma factor [Massilibacteroides sp.]|nr:sigma-70 family RNA polymerase sigma factor [Massilibacteroides sp.]MDD3061698.1 sigma-70 family RNA polymerase sigma factor [Massilibacteroides sp.]MDD4114339.1 sigma-70 family RNA polymerase sigma factor [Massilibacteroides sp.]MDD4660257.1 sigma-70 family RNA polymerase sigma factor [Massilibacteroides sp.]